MQIRKKTIWVMGLLMSATSLFAMKLVPQDSRTYYKIGGSSTLLVPVVQSAKPIRLGADVNSTLSPSCSNFNPMVSVNNSFNGLKDSFVGIPTQMVQNTTVAIKGYALAKVQQSLPGIFDSMLNQKKHIGTEFKFKRQSCEKVQRQVAAGGSPLDGLLGLSDSQGWVDSAKRAASGNGDVDVVKEETKITQERQTYGVPWIHSNQTYSGGKDQAPIKVISDVVIAGYNLIANDSGNVMLDSISPPPDNSQANFLRFWPNPKVAAMWATKVVGDISFTKDEAKKNSTDGDVVAGIGLAAMLQTCPEIGSNANTCPKMVNDYIWQMINGEKPIDVANLERLNSGGMAVSFEVMQTIRHMGKSDQIITISKLSHDLATQNLIEEALALRRILLAGFQVQQVQNLKPIRDTVKDTIALLDKEIESLVFENKVRAELSNKTLSTILEIRDESMIKAGVVSKNDAQQVVNGAIYARTGEDK